MQWEAEPGPDAVTPELRDELADCLVYLVALVRRAGRGCRRRRRDPAAQRRRGRTAVSGERPLPCLRATATGSAADRGRAAGPAARRAAAQLEPVEPGRTWQRDLGPARRHRHPDGDRQPPAGRRSSRSRATFDFSTVDAQIEQARARGMRLVLIWFGAFKNAALDVRAADGCARDAGGSRGRSRRHGRGAVHLRRARCRSRCSSVFSPELLDADRRAFVALHGAPGRRRPGRTPW